MTTSRRLFSKADPSNDLNFVRFRTKKEEIMVAPEKQYLLVVVHHPQDLISNWTELFQSYLYIITQYVFDFYNKVIYIPLLDSDCHTIICKLFLNLVTKSILKISYDSYFMTKLDLSWILNF